MAALVLGVVGASVGGALLGSFSILGITISGAALGGVIGATIGSYIDNMLFNKPQNQSFSQTGQRLDSIQFQESTEGSAIPRLYGRFRLAGELIWSTKFLETIKTTTTTTTTGGKGGGGGGSTTTTTTTEYLYSCSFAIAMCEGLVHRVERIWADGNLLDLSTGGSIDGSGPITYRIYYGSEGQPVDPLMEAKEGPGNNPAYRGVAYIVFEDLPLKQFGNRIPQFQFEVVRCLGREYSDQMETMVTGVCMIPGTGEFAYATQVVNRQVDGGTEADNRVSVETRPNFLVATDQLQALIPTCDTVALVVGWFGTDLRCDQCEIKPGVELRNRSTSPMTWSVAGYDRSTAYLVSQTDGRLNYGGTPDDASVKQAIQELKARGFKVILYPFLFMDIPAGNTLPNPYSDNASETGQAVHPWRGRITVSPAPGYAGSPDKTATAATQVNAFYDNQYIPFITHYANLAVTAGGVDGFLIGSEYVGLTAIRSSSGAGTYPAVEKLRDLAATVKGIVGSGCKVGYAADWSEYHSHRPSDGSGDVIFNMDRLWSHSAIDFIGIDNYMPMSDWRDGESHLDFLPTRKIYDRDYLQSNIRGGEFYNWYYVSEQDRIDQIRTTITDGTYGKPWVYRNKDIWNWWSNTHVHRVGGTETSASSWTPEGKPIWFTELGCPSVDKGSNQPNVFFDPKSSESFLPYFSHGWRDDQMQRSFIEAHLSYWADNANNPLSSVFGGRMLDTSKILFWCWDARPFPYYPKLGTLWGDADNWNRGHWLNGRAGLAPVPLVVRDLLERQGFTAYDISEITGTVTGYQIDQPMSARAAIEPLGGVFFFDGVESEGKIVFRRRDRPSVGSIVDDDLIGKDGKDDSSDNSPFEITREQESELPRSLRLQYVDAAADYRTASAPSRRLATTSKRDLSNTAPFVMEQAEAIGVAEAMLIEAWVRRENVKFILPPTALAYEAGDVITAMLAGRQWVLRLTGMSDAHVREAEAQRTDRSVYVIHSGPIRSYTGAPTSADGQTINQGGSGNAPNSFGQSLLALMDLPLLSGAEDEAAFHVAAFAKPWTPQRIFRSADGTSFALNATALSPAAMGVTTADFYSGPLNRWDRVNTLAVRMFGDDALASKSDLLVYGGGNVIFVENPDGGWEVVQFANADLTGSKQYSLTKLLRGQQGTEHEMRDPVPTGARVVVFDTASAGQVALGQDEIGLPFTWRCGPDRFDYSDESYQQIVKAGAGVGFRPYSPCFVRAVKDSGSGDITISWIRRTRKNGDSWETASVPLNEETEAYEVNIMDGALVKRTLSTSTPSVVYSAAQQTADWGGPASAPLTVRVFQLSAVVGRGAKREVELAY